VDPIKLDRFVSLARSKLPRDPFQWELEVLKVSLPLETFASVAVPANRQRVVGPLLPKPASVGGP